MSFLRWWAKLEGDKDDLVINPDKIGCFKAENHLQQGKSLDNQTQIIQIIALTYSKYSLLTLSFHENGRFHEFSRENSHFITT